MVSHPLHPLVMRAKLLARNAHRGQLRRGGKPYITHVAAVAEAVRASGGDAEAQAVAWLHETLEDTWVTETILRNARFPESVIAAIVALTHLKHEPNLAYWARVKANRIAAEVKPHDIDNNLSDDPTPYQVEKYGRALAFLRYEGELPSPA